MAFNRNVLKTSTAAAALIAFATPVPAFAQAQNWQFNLPAQPLEKSLRSIARQTRQQVTFEEDAVRGKTAPAVKGSLTADQALQAALAGSGLEASKGNSGLFIIRPQGELGNVQSAAAEAASSGDSSQSERGISEILVIGSRSRNVDIRRSENDAQPYVVFDSEEIQNSGATSVEDFLKSRLTMNTARENISQQVNSPSATGGNIDLRGFGTNQTLVLIDGRRIVSSASSIGQDLAQASLEGVPLAAIERIEVLPASAGAIYGGGATGGVVNIIKKRNYTGLDLSAQYDNTFRGDAGSIELSANGGMTFGSGATAVTFSAQYSDVNGLKQHKRDFARDARELILKNNPTEVTNSFVPVWGTTSNICAASVFVIPGVGAFGSCDPFSTLTLDNGQTVASAISSVPGGYGGPGTDNGQALAANGGVYNIETPEDDALLTRTSERMALSFGVIHDFSQRLKAYMDYSFSNTNDDLPTSYVTNLTVLSSDGRNPFQEDIVVSAAVPELTRNAKAKAERQQLTFGAIVRPIDRWSAVVEYNRGKAKSRYRQKQGDLLNAAGRDALVDSLFQDQVPFDYHPYLTSKYDFDSGWNKLIQNQASLRVSGPLARLPAGDLVITGLAEFRKERLADRVTEGTTAGASYFTWIPSRDQKVVSVYAEAQIPLVSPAMELPLVRSFEAQASIRHDQYRTKAPVTNGNSGFVPIPSEDGPFPDFDENTNKVSANSYLLALRYAPIQGAILRGSFATGFLPPSLLQIVPEPPATIFFSNDVDPARGGSPVLAPYQVLNGGNPDLEPERSKTWSMGVIFEPKALTGLRLSFDYSKIRRTDQISSASSQFVLNNEQSFPGRVIRGPNLPTDQPGWLGPVQSIDTTLFNLVSSKAKFLDIQANYDTSIGNLGNIGLSVVATKTFKFEQQIVDNGSKFNNVGFSDGPLPWKATAGVVWKYDRWNLGWDLTYFDSYKIISAVPGADFINNLALLNQGSEKIGSQTYNDLYGIYRIPKSAGGLLGGVEVLLAIRNVLDKKPPIVAGFNALQAVGGYSPYGDPRLRRFQIALRKSLGS